jgi:hypothetical protein
MNDAFPSPSRDGDVEIRQEPDGTYQTWTVGAGDIKEFARGGFEDPIDAQAFAEGLVRVDGRIFLFTGRCPVPVEVWREAASDVLE